MPPEQRRWWDYIPLVIVTAFMVAGVLYVLLGWTVGLK
jgi:hypothetical protein